jgi:hypothetical protein
MVIVMNHTNLPANLHMQANAIPSASKCSCNCKCKQLQLQAIATASNCNCKQLQLQAIASNCLPKPIAKMNDFNTKFDNKNLNLLINNMIAWMTNFGAI